MVILRLGNWGRGREIGGGTSTPRIRHMLLLPPLLQSLLLLLPAFDNNYTPASRNPYKLPSIPLDYRRKSRCAGEASREGNRFVSKLADHYAKLAKCDGTRFRATLAPLPALRSNLRDDFGASLLERAHNGFHLFAELQL